MTKSSDPEERAYTAAYNDDVPKWKQFLVEPVLVRRMPFQHPVLEYLDGLLFFSTCLLLAIPTFFASSGSNTDETTVTPRLKWVTALRKWLQLPQAFAVSDLTFL